MLAAKSKNAFVIDYRRDDRSLNTAIAILYSRFAREPVSPRLPTPAVVDPFPSACTIFRREICLAARGKLLKSSMRSLCYARREIEIAEPESRNRNFHED